MAERLERLINLVIALRQTRVPLQAADINARVAGYGQDGEAFRRMFERDKADLRDLGVPIETAPIDRWGDQLGYRIDPRQYDLPPLALAPEELAALSLAVQAAGLADEGSPALRKLAVAADAAAPTDPVPTARIDVGRDVPHRDQLAAAQVTRTTVAFGYRAGTGETSERTVDPHGLVHRGGRWYLVGADHDRQATRVFRLDRITGPVRTISEPAAFVAPAEAVTASAVVPAVPDDEVELAVVSASDDVAWQVARRARGEGRDADDGSGWTTFDVPVLEPAGLRSWLRQLGQEVVLVAPAPLRETFITELRALAASAEDDG